MSATRSTRYLPVRIADQSYSIVMDVVLAVHSLADAESIYSSVSSAVPGTAEADQFTGSGVPMVNLGILLGDTWRQSTPRYAVIVATPAGSCALLVDAIRSPVNMLPDEVHALPYLLTLTGCPFNAMISVEQERLPVIDVTRLLEHLRTVRPDLVTEVDYVG
jgi:chemotaxis signal transduction protein